MFDSENDMQAWLSGELKEKDLGELIINIDEFEKKEAINLEERKVKESFTYCLKSLHLTSVISEDENISLKPGDTLRPDFLLYASETESIVIVELKNISGPTRQAGTEIHAYSSELKSYIPFISEGDIVNVIISTSWPVLLKHYVFHEIFWLQRNIICLEPIIENNEKKLVIKDISFLIDGTVPVKLCDRHLGGYQICLYKNGSGNMDSNIEQMKTSVLSMAVKGNTQRNHGFAILWKDLWINTMAPYSITVVNFAPFNSLERLFHAEDFEPNEITERIIKDIIIECAPEGHGQSLESIREHGSKFLQAFSSPRAEGFHTWDVLKKSFQERAKLISFHSWGIFDELFSDKLAKEYEKGNLNISASDPKLGLKTIEEMLNPNYQFINLSYYNHWNDEDEDEL